MTLAATNATGQRSHSLLAYEQDASRQYHQEQWQGQKQECQAGSAPLHGQELPVGICQFNDH